jgi:hypothetical protein
MNLPLESLGLSGGCDHLARGRFAVLGHGGLSVVTSQQAARQARGSRTGLLKAGDRLSVGFRIARWLNLLRHFIGIAGLDDLTFGRIRSMLGSAGPLDR